MKTKVQHEGTAILAQAEFGFPSCMRVCSRRDHNDNFYHRASLSETLSFTSVLFGRRTLLLSTSLLDTPRFCLIFKRMDGNICSSAHLGYLAIWDDVCFKHRFKHSRFLTLLRLLAPGGLCHGRRHCRIPGNITTPSGRRSRLSGLEFFLAMACARDIFEVHQTTRGGT